MDLLKQALNKMLISKLFAVIVTLIGIVVCAGWMLNIPLLTNISTDFVSMKFITSVMFILSGIMIYLIIRRVEDKYGEVGDLIIQFCVILAMFLVVVPLVSSIFAIPTGIENIFIRESASAVKTVAPGLPAIPTLISFALIISVVLTLVAFRENINLITGLSRLAGIIILFIGAVACAGYIFGIQILYYYIPGVTTAIAVHTSIAFVLCGAALVICGLNKIKVSE